MTNATGYATIDHSLTDLVEACRSAGFVDLTDAAEQLRADCRAQRTRVAIVGEFNRGKTTLVNRLLGQAFLPTGPVPTTRCITEIRYGETPRISLRYRDGSERDLSTSQLADIGDGDLTGEEELRVEYPDPLLRSLTLIDTPGINDVERARSDLVYRVLPTSDAVVLVLSADQALTSSEWRFLESHLLAGERQHVLFVLTKGDLLCEVDQEAVRSRVLSDLGRLMPFPHVVLTGAEEGLVSGDPSSDRLTGIRTWLTELFVEPSRALGVGLFAWRLRALLASVDQRLARHARSQTEDAEQARLDEEARREQRDSLERRHTRMRDRLARRLEVLSETLAIDVVHDVHAFAESLKDEVKTVTLEEARKHLSGYVRSALATLLEISRANLERGCGDLLADLTSEDTAAHPTAAPPRVEDTGQTPVVQWEDSLHELGINRFLFWAKLTGVAGLALNPMVGAGLLAASATVAWLSKDAREARQLSEMAAGARAALLAGLPDLREAVTRSASSAQAALEAEIDALFGQVQASIELASRPDSADAIDATHAQALGARLAEIRCALASVGVAPG